MEIFNDIFTDENLKRLFPAKERTDHFFDALFGDPEEGAYEISLKFKGASQTHLDFEFHLEQRPGKCLACNLTYGLPQVFSRHPIININGLVQEIEKLLDGKATCSDWQLGVTQEKNRELHTIPLRISLNR